MNIFVFIAFYTIIKFMVNIVLLCSQTHTLSHVTYIIINNLDNIFPRAMLCYVLHFLQYASCKLLLCPRTRSAVASILNYHYHASALCIGMISNCLISSWDRGMEYDAHTYVYFKLNNMKYYGIIVYL